MKIFTISFGVLYITSNTEYLPDDVPLLLSTVCPDGDPLLVSTVCPNDDPLLVSTVRPIRYSIRYTMKTVIVYYN